MKPPKSAWDHKEEWEQLDKIEREKQYSVHAKVFIPLQ